MLFSKKCLVNTIFPNDVQNKNPGISVKKTLQHPNIINGIEVIVAVNLIMLSKKDITVAATVFTREVTFFKRVELESILF